VSLGLVDIAVPGIGMRIDGHSRESEKQSEGRILQVAAGVSHALGRGQAKCRLKAKKHTEICVRLQARWVDRVLSLALVVRLKNREQKWMSTK
jgi:hypothetical protein